MSTFSHNHWSKPESSKRLGRLRWPLAVCLAVLAVGIAGFSHFTPDNSPAPTAGVAVPAEPASAPNPTAPGTTESVTEAGILRENPQSPEPNYDTEEFTHVPAWIPRPANAHTASAEDASLRSDGFVEGTVRFVFTWETTAAIKSITAHLEAAGMLAEPGGTLFSSENPPRRCEVRLSQTSGGAVMAQLSYQGTDHEKGCRCPTCGSSPQYPEP